MQSQLVQRSFSTPHVPITKPNGKVANGPRWRAYGGSPDQQFIMMLHAYRDSGGLSRVQELLALFSRNGGPDVARLARWIVEREIICFEWQSQTWLPMFQFNRMDLEPAPRLQPLFAELAPVYDHWDMAAWFARPSPWLASRIPVDMLGSDFPAVLSAARADRFAASG